MRYLANNRGSEFKKQAGINCQDIFLLFAQVARKGTKTTNMSPEPEPEYRRNASLLETESKDSDFLPKGEKTIAEPLPEWSKAIKEWGVAWEFHQYGLGAVYALLFFMISMWLWKRIRRVLTGNQGNKVPIIVLSLLGFFCLTRSLCLCIDAYHWRKITPVAFVNVL